MKKSDLIRIIKEEIASLLLENPERVKKTEAILTRIRQDLANAQGALEAAKDENDSEAIRKASTRINNLKDQIEYYEQDSSGGTRS